MEGQSQLYTVASVIGVIVIFAMAACFAILFAVYANQKIKNLRGGLLNKFLKKGLDLYPGTFLGTFVHCFHHCDAGSGFHWFNQRLFFAANSVNKLMNRQLRSLG